MAGLTSQQETIAAVWAQHQPTMVERVELLERAQTDPELRDEAREAAHQLAGTVGTFGFPRASELARRCETLLRDNAGLSELPELVAGIRAEINEAPFTATTASVAPPPPTSPSVSLQAPPPPPQASPPPPPPPMAPPPAPRPPARPEPRSAAMPLVLVVTDDAGTSERLRTEAGRRGLRVSAARVAEVRSRLTREAPAAVLVDLTAPGALDGLADLQLDHPEVPVLVVAEDDTFEGRLEAAQRGVVGYLDASVTPAEVIDEVALSLQRRAGVGDRILVVSYDDEARSALEAGGFEVAVLPGVDELWEELSQINPTLMVLDSDHLELCRVVRNDRRWSVIPIVVAGEGDPTEVFAAGADDLAPPEELIARVGNHLSRYRVHQALAETDSLTGLRNRRTSTAALSHLIRLAERLDRPFCVAEIDIDHFKLVNDKHGHIAGDAVLRRLGELLKREFRGEDVVARWGGEEFVVGLFGLDRDRGIDRLSDLLKRFRAETFTNAHGESFSLTFSAGVAQYPSDGADLEALYGAADEALYSAKRGGRDQVAGGGQGSSATQQVDVAIIEDEDATSELIAHALNGQGLRCFRFSNGAGAVGMLLGDSPRVRARVILVDLNLPVVSGMELLTVFGREGVLDSSRALVVSAHNDPETVAKARALGADDYIVKPIDLDNLISQVDAALGRR